MTVIAYDGVTLSADRRITCGDVLLAPENKIYARGDNAIAQCGAAVSEETLNLALTALAKGKRRDLPYKGSAFALMGTTAFWLHEGEATVLVAPCAIGTGAEIARGAMAAGKTAAEAVAIACQLVVSCGDGVDTFTQKEAA